MKLHQHELQVVTCILLCSPRSVRGGKVIVFNTVSLIFYTNYGLYFYTCTHRLRTCDTGTHSGKAIWGNSIQIKIKEYTRQSLCSTGAATTLTTHPCRFLVPHRPRLFRRRVIQINLVPCFNHSGRHKGNPMFTQNIG